MNKHVGVRALLVVTLAMLLVVTGGCGKKKKGITPGIDGAAGGNGNQMSDLEQEKLLFGKSGLEPVYFDYDSFTLRPDAIATLNKNAELIKQTSSIAIQVAGHCDERGTQEYNLALGEKRAQAVRSFLVQAGVAGNRLVTISYGEECPAVQGTGEAVWAKNRRAEFNKATM